jgi:hypothetical protein
MGKNLSKLNEKGEKLSQVKEKISTWSKEKINNYSVNDVLKIEEFPLWWYYQRLLEINFIPFQKKNDQVWKDILEGKKPTNLSKAKNTILLWSFKKFINYSEKVKALLIRKSIAKDYVDLSSKKKKVLFLSYTKHLIFKDEQRIYFRINDLINKIKLDPDIDAEVLTISPFPKFEINKTRNENNIYNHLNKDIKKKAKNISKELSKKWKKLSKERKKKLFRIKENESINIYDYFSNQINFFYSQEMIYLIALYYFAFKKMIIEDKIDAVYTSAISSIYEKCLVSAASKLNKPAFMCQHGVAIGFINNQIENLYSMNFLVMGNKYKEEIISAGIPKENVFVTGPLIFNEILPYLKQEQTKEQKQKQSQTPRNIKPVILFMTSPIIEDNFMNKKDYFVKVKRILEECKKVQAEKSDQNIEVIIKLHPREEYEEEFSKLAKEIGLRNWKVIKACTRPEHFKFLQNCSLLLNYGSTTALEAMILGKPIITVDVFDKGKNPINHFIRESDATLKIDWNQNITKMLLETLNNPDILKEERKKFIEEHCYKLDGHSEKRAIEIIKEKL